MEIESISHSSEPCGLPLTYRTKPLKRFELLICPYPDTYCIYRGTAFPLMLQWQRRQWNLNPRPTGLEPVILPD